MTQISTKGRTARRNTFPHKRTVLWAARSFPGKLGNYIGVALDDGRLTVAIATVSGVRWVSANEALSDAKASTWVASGFQHRTPLA